MCYMNDFIEFETKPIENNHHIWAEKYRPVKIDDYIGNEAFKDELKNIVSTGQLNHLMLYGNIPGTGKTTAAKLIVKSIKCDYIYLNCSDTNSIDDGCTHSMPHHLPLSPSLDIRCYSIMLFLV